MQIDHGNLRSSSGGYFFHAVIQHICGIFCFQEATWGDSKSFLECSKMMIRFPCQKAIILEDFTYFPIALTIHSFQESCAPILFFKNFKNSHLSCISNLHALIEFFILFFMSHISPKSAFTFYESKLCGKSWLEFYFLWS